MFKFETHSRRLGRSLRRRALQIAGSFALFALVPAAHAACTFGASSEISLQAVFNAIVTPPGAVSTTAGCLADGSDAQWHTVGGSGSATILIEVAGFSNSNVLGIYDPLSVVSGSPTRTLDIFAGSASAGATATITVTQVSGGYNVSVNGGAATLFSSQNFGYYLRTPGQNGAPSGATFYSNTALNSDGLDHMYAYLGSGQSFRSGWQTATEPGKPSRNVWAPGGVFGPNDAILAWEDLLSSGSDRDYQDMVVLTRQITPVPVPAALGFLLVGAAGLARFRRRKADAT